jgi:DNA adenine methylase
MAQVECKDFEDIITRYERPTTLFYCDPPYIGAEFYYGDVAPFGIADHERLAQLLNATSAQVALSYYPHPLIDELYPVSKWRRITWQTYKHAEKTGKDRQTATELLLMNYPAVQQDLWIEGEVSA